jgi:hypothetical protein
LSRDRVVSLGPVLFCAFACEAARRAGVETYFRLLSGFAGCSSCVWSRSTIIVVFSQVKFFGALVPRRGSIRGPAGGFSRRSSCPLYHRERPRLPIRFFLPKPDRSLGGPERKPVEPIRADLRVFGARSWSICGSRSSSSTSRSSVQAVRLWARGGDSASADRPGAHAAPRRPGCQTTFRRSAGRDESQIRIVGGRLSMTGLRLRAVRRLARESEDRTPTPTRTRRLLARTISTLPVGGLGLLATTCTGRNAGLGFAWSRRMSSRHHQSSLGSFTPSAWQKARTDRLLRFQRATTSRQ